ncbi:MAG TPA: hypothetical protein VNA57_06500 [Acidimicrobiales bacterium]|nr:hypothetical protein [Acidimicrobiales bacterium]
MPRTKVNLDASVLHELKDRQRKEKKPLGQLISEILARELESGAARAAPFSWVTKDLRPRVDLEDKDALWSILDKA